MKKRRTRKKKGLAGLFATGPSASKRVGVKSHKRHTFTAKSRPKKLITVKGYTRRKAKG